MSHKNIINGGRQSTYTGGGSGGGTTPITFEHMAITVPWVSDLGDTEVFTVDFFKQGLLVTMVMPRVMLDMQGVSNWRRANLVAHDWLPQHHVAVTFPAATNINSTVGKYEYDVDIMCLAEVTVYGSVIVYREPPPGTMQWDRPDDTSRVGWNSWSVSWTVNPPD